MKRLIITVFAIAGAGAGRARAEPPTPWARDVPAAQQERARALFEDGNQLFAQQAHGPALDRYRAAVALWDHPMIRFNMAVTEIRLDRVLDAAEDLQAALRFGQGSVLVTAVARLGFPSVLSFGVIDDLEPYFAGYRRFVLSWLQLPLP